MSKILTIFILSLAAPTVWAGTWTCLATAHGDRDRTIISHQLYSASGTGFSKLEAEDNAMSNLRKKSFGRSVSMDYGASVASCEKENDEKPIYWTCQATVLGMQFGRLMFDFRHSATGSGSTKSEAKANAMDRLRDKAKNEWNVEVRNLSYGAEINECESEDASKN